MALARSLKVSMWALMNLVHCLGASLILGDLEGHCFAARYPAEAQPRGEEVAPVRQERTGGVKPEHDGLEGLLAVPVGRHLRDLRQSVPAAAGVVPADDLDVQVGLQALQILAHGPHALPGVLVAALAARE